MGLGGFSPKSGEGVRTANQRSGHSCVRIDPRHGESRGRTVAEARERTHIGKIGVAVRNLRCEGVGHNKQTKASRRGQRTPVRQGKGPPSPMDGRAPREAFREHPAPPPSNAPCLQERICVVFLPASRCQALPVAKQPKTKGSFRLVIPGRVLQKAGGRRTTPPTNPQFESQLRLGEAPGGP